MRIPKPLALAAIDLQRNSRQRSNYFFVFAFPMLLILVLGMAYGGGVEPRVGVLVGGAGPRAEQLAAELRAADGIDVHVIGSESDLVSRVEHGELEAGVVIPAGYDTAVGAPSGAAEVRFLARPGIRGEQVRSVVTAVVVREASMLRAARFAAAETGADFTGAVAGTEDAAERTPRISVLAHSAGTADFPEELGRFDTGASSQLVLFIFITSLTTATALIETRRLGVARRMLASPTHVTTIVLGAALGRFGVAVVQGAFIMLGSALIFGVSWGDPLAAVVLMLAFSLAAAGAGMLLGSTMRTVQQAIAVGLLLGLGFAALGGTMMPLEFYTPAVRMLAHLTPHAWAVDGYAELLRRDGGITDIATELGVLSATALVLFALAARRLRRSISA
ncbi:ABC transporter permease [Nocardia sp. IFM 10818]